MMKDLNQEVQTLIKEMDSLKTVDDDTFIQFYEKEKALQNLLSSKSDAGELRPEEKKAYSKQLTEAFARLQSKISFCSLS